MAKAVELPDGVYDVGGKGRKPCPHVKVGETIHYVAGRASHCPLCNKDIAPKEKKAGSGGRNKKAGKAPAMDALAVIAKVKDFGGVAKVQKTLNEITAMQAKVDEARIPCSVQRWILWRGGRPGKLPLNLWPMLKLP